MIAKDVKHILSDKQQLFFIVKSLIIKAFPLQQNVIGNFLIADVFNTDFNSKVCKMSFFRSGSARMIVLLVMLIGNGLSMSPYERLMKREAPQGNER